ncbi:OmpA family protein [Paucibacter sp. PLA-PC-4]|uniref:OmpA family protein n=1 Tax=Paucibacter sp. PLA-PC-4 TaxID=2993655 RepID=UPI00224B501B|nr:OmpA family protein [Paucibacter sp. PLA-PC-4]MCX2863460.1 OmpA family protein [Paucibacter sp. PLA-PC-4]
MTTNALFDENEGVALRLVGIIVALVVALVIGFGVHKSRSMAKPAQQPAAVLVEEDVAAILVENGVVKFFFASASAELAGGANEALTQLTQALAEGKTLVVSGYHDASGDAAMNAELAKQRAMAVREALLSLGVGEGRIELSKPELATGSGSPRQARRVEVLLR